MNKTSKSDQLYRLLLERISRLSDGDNFPTLREIMREYRVSQFTAAPALKRLQEKGLIASHVGRGSVVTRTAGRRHGATILYLRPDWPSFSIQAMEEAMTGEAAARGYHCEILRYDIAADIYRQLPGFEADAVILDPIQFDHFTAEQLQILTSSVRPVVLCRSTLPVFNIKCVGSHLMETGITAANYLYRNGHRKIGVLFSEGRSYTMTTVVDTLLLCARTLGCEVTVLDANIRARSRFLPPDPGVSGTGVQAGFHRAFRMQLRDRPRNPRLPALARRRRTGGTQSAQLRFRHGAGRGAVHQFRGCARSPDRRRRCWTSSTTSFPAISPFRGRSISPRKSREYQSVQHLSGNIL